MSILSLLLCRREDEESVEQRELEAERRREKRLEREEERRLAQFAKDEQVYMNYMNDQLVKEQRELERRRKRESIVQERANRRASIRSQKRKQNIRNYLKNQKSESLSRLHGIEGSSSQETLDTQDSSNDEEDYVESFHNEDLQGEENASTAAFAEEAEEDEEDFFNCMYQKTIRWCPSVEEEQERRRIYRAQFPVKKGGIARRVRKLRKEKQEFFLDELEEDDDSFYDGKSIAQDSISYIADEEDLDKLVSEYRKIVTMSLEGNY